MQHFLAQGCFISAPVFDIWKTDFVIEWQGELAKVNVKTMSQAPNAFHVQLQTGGGGKNRRLYQPGEIDYFGIVNLAYEMIWLVPLEAVEGRTLISWIPEQLRVRKIAKRAFKWDQYRIK